jgi:hypothetical protein
MKCKICSTQFNYCGSCYPESSSDFGVCEACWKGHGIREKYWAIDEACYAAKNALQKEIDAIAKEKNQ